jgi:hypothetical protein
MDRIDAMAIFSETKRKDGERAGALVLFRK